MNSQNNTNNMMTLSQFFESKSKSDFNQPKRSKCGFDYKTIPELNEQQKKTFDFGKDFYHSRGFAWGCNSLKGDPTPEDLEKFKCNFDSFFFHLQTYFRYLSKADILGFLKFFTETTMFERLYYHTCPYDEFDVDEFLQHVQPGEHDDFLYNFWKSIHLMSTEDFNRYMIDSIKLMTR